ncbi:DegT/DnrJ/EryC1/StrS family aminotransferase [Candidatus Magnetaquicoccus inordinatus]|uniref:DegT/DnrJ/EryC1/StrS family aminotransferase n=1 Tax=Candidatus Magnetaquicoccus inordinatus TaxID=2496818 RepID=UPI00102D04E2|nr:DegT/DnrJ/EryC1/StrS family aminotransferase [Candidatus Magnetaquicoccus inordinatus]
MTEEAIAFSKPWMGAEELQLVQEVLQSRWLVGGAKLAEFERLWAEYCGCRQAIGLSSWTTGAFLVLHAWGIQPGDEVIVPSLTFIASVNVIRHVGATPVFADIDPLTWNIDPEDVARKITPRTKVIMPVDQLGLPCAIDAINVLAQQHGLRVLDDAACAFGSRNQGRAVGSLADVSIFSLHARKIITTGEGGMIVTDDTELAERLRRLRHQGMSLSDFARHNASPTTFESYPEVGYNYRITDIQAAIGLAQLARLEEILARRRSIAERYLSRLAHHPCFRLPFVPEGMQPNWQSFQIAVSAESPLNRNQWMERLHAQGVPTRRGVMAAHREAPYQALAATLPHTEAATATTLQLPIYPEMSEQQQEQVLAALVDY